MSLEPGIATVLLGLGAAASWGVGDFGGGLSSRRAPVLGVVLVVQSVGAVLLAVSALARGELLPAPSTVGLAVATGVVGAAAILAFYHALAVGRMGVAAPVAAVVGAMLPVVVGLVLLGAPNPAVVLGIVLGIAAVVLVSRVPAPSGGRSGIEPAIIAGAFIGVFSVLVSRYPTGQFLWPLALTRTTSVAAVVTVILVGRRSWRVPRPALPLALVVGCLDVAGNALYVMATQAGRLDVAVVLSSLYPVVTVILAVAILGERLTRSHLAGIAAAAAAVALIATG